MKKFTLLLLVTTLILGGLSTSCRSAEAPPTAEEYFKQGLTYDEKGELDKAIADLEKCIELSRDPELSQDAERWLEELKKLK